MPTPYKKSAAKNGNRRGQAFKDEAVKDCEKERDQLLATSRQARTSSHHWLTAAATLLEVGIAICTVAIITKKPLVLDRLADPGGLRGSGCSGLRIWVKLPIWTAMTDLSPPKTVLIVGASRGLGYAMAEEYLKRGWRVVGTVARRAHGPLCTDLADRSDGRVEIEAVDINHSRPDRRFAAPERLPATNGSICSSSMPATSNANPENTVAEVSTDEFVRVMITNALSPLRVARSLAGPRAADGGDRGHVVWPGQCGEQHHGDARGLSRLEGGAQHLHAQFRGAPCG